MEIVNLDQFRQRRERDSARPRVITFRSAQCADDKNNVKAHNISVRIADGDALGILEAVKDHGGIGCLADDGTYYFLPWPCACVEIRDE